MATWNSAEKSSSITLSGGDLVATNDVTGDHAVKCSKYVGAGKWYWEIEIGEDGTTPQMFVGFGNSTLDVDVQLGEDVNSWGYFAFDGKVQYDGSFTSYGNSFVTGDIIGVALDLTTGEAWFSKNNVWQNGGDPVAGTNPAFTGISDIVAPMWSGYNSGDVVTGKFDEVDWTYSAPSGYISVADLPIEWSGIYIHSSIARDNNNLTARKWVTAQGKVLAEEDKSTGKWYWEVLCENSGIARVGCCTISSDLGTYLGIHADDYGYSQDGSKVNNSSSQGFGATYSSGDIIGVALDLDNGRIWWSKNGVWQASGNPSTGANPAYTGLSGTYRPAWSGYNSSAKGTLASITDDFTYPIPTDFDPLGKGAPPEPPPGTVEEELNENVRLGDTFEYNWGTQQEETETVGLNDTWIVSNPIYTIIADETGLADVIESTSPQWTEINEEVGLTDSLIGYSLSTGYSDEVALSAEITGYALTGYITEKVGIIDEWYVDIDRQININESYHEQVTSLCTITTTFTAPKGEVVDSLEPLEAFAFGNDYTLGILEALEATVVGEVGNVCSVDVDLAALTCEAFGGAFVDATLEALESTITGVVSNVASCSADLPALQASVQGYISNIGYVDTSLPALEALVTAIVSGYGYVDASLLHLIGDVTGITGTSIIVDAALEALSADILGYVQPIGTVTASLLPIDAYVIGNISNRFDDYILKHVR